MFKALMNTMYKDINHDWDLMVVVRVRFILMGVTTFAVSLFMIYVFRNMVTKIDYKTEMIVDYVFKMNKEKV